MKFFAKLSSMFLRNRWENGAFWLLRGVIHDLGRGGGLGGFAVSFFMILVFWLKISMPGSADDISQNN